jgi:hypothetical protein
MPSGRKCHGYALRGGNFCYFHSRLHLAAQKPAGKKGPVEIPVLEDRCAIQVTITRILRAIVNNTIDRPRASLLLYGLQLALQSVDRNGWAIPVGTVEALSHTSDGDELAADPDDDDEDEDDEEEEDSDPDESDAESGDDSGGEDDENSDDGSEEENAADDEDDGDEDGDDGLDNRTTGELIADLKYLDSIKRQAGLDP